MHNDTDGPQVADTAAAARDAWKASFGDPDDPSVKEQIAAVVDELASRPSEPLPTCESCGGWTSPLDVEAYSKTPMGAQLTGFNCQCLFAPTETPSRSWLLYRLSRNADHAINQYGGLGTEEDWYARLLVTLLVSRRGFSYKGFGYLLKDVAALALAALESGVGAESNQLSAKPPTVSSGTIASAIIAIAGGDITPDDRSAVARMLESAIAGFAHGQANVRADVGADPPLPQ